MADNLININLDPTPTECSLDTKIWFGKYKGTMLYLIMEQDLNYVKWMMGEKLITLNKEANLYFKSEVRDQVSTKRDAIQDTRDRFDSAVKDYNKRR